MFLFPQLEDPEVVHNIIDKVNCECELFSEKRPETRVKALNSTLNCFRMHYLDLDNSWNYRATFLSGLESILRKGRSLDRTLAAECLSIFCLQYDVAFLPDFFGQFFPILDPVCRDGSENCAVRAAAATALAMLKFQSNDCDVPTLKALMKSFESIFKGSCLKGDGKAHVLNPSTSALHVASLRAWGLLYTFLTNQEAVPSGQAMLPCLVSLMQGNDVEMRILAGEIVALIYERLRSTLDDRYRGPYYTDVVRLLNELATDSSKSRSKVDRKRQRQLFRDLSESVAHFECLETPVSFGSEVLTLSSCLNNFYYSFLCTLLKGGMSRHLQENELVRDLFDLGPPVMVSHNPVDRRVLKCQQRQALAVISKARSQNMSNLRGCRNLVLGED